MCAGRDNSASRNSAEEVLPKLSPHIEMGMPAPKGLPPTQLDMDRYGEYMLAAQAALREPIGQARTRAHDLESKKHRLAEPEQLEATDFTQSNDARVRVATLREELMRALASN